MFKSKHSPTQHPQDGDQLHAWDRVAGPACTCACSSSRAPLFKVQTKRGSLLLLCACVRTRRDAQSCIATTSFAGSPRASTTTFIWVTSTQRSFCAIIAAAFALHAGASSSGQWLPTASPALPRPSASALVLLQYSYALSQPMHLRYEYEYDTTCKSQK